MVAWSSDTFLAAFAYGSALVATLRAGSRALYLMEHDQIDVMDGPLILGPHDVTILPNGTSTIEVSPLWELASVFRESVRLALEPNTMEYRVLSVGMPQDDNEKDKEPYSLSPFPTKKRGVPAAEEEDDFIVEDLDDENAEEVADVEILAQDIVGERSSNRLAKPPSFVSRISVRGMFGKVPLVGRWMRQPDDSDDDDEESFSFDDMELDGTCNASHRCK
jgi:hypothetical protein